MNAPRCRVLVVDDEQKFLVVLRDFLERHGYAVDVAATAIDALAIVRANRPDVVLLDLNMPGDLTGGSVIRTLCATTSVIVITGANDIDVARRTLLDGARDFLAKPFRLERIVELIEAARAGR